MNRPRFLVPLATLALLAASLLTPAGLAQATSETTGEAPAGVGPNAFTVTASPLDIMTGPEDAVAVTLDLDIYLPANATAATPAPAVIHTHGFGGSKANGESVANATYLASKGYVVITHSTQGFGASTGCIGLDSTDYDAKNLGKIVDLLATMPEVATNGPGDPKVGLLGGSYGGGLQGGAAFLDSRIDAIAIGRSWNALQYSLVPNNWVINPDEDLFDLISHEQGVFKQTWTSLFFGSGAARGVQAPGSCDPVSQQLAYPGQPPCPGFIPDICPIYAALTSTGDSLPGQREVIFKTSIEHYIDQIDTPTMVVQGLPDTLFTATEAAATFTALAERGVPTQMIWISSGHGGYFSVPGEAEAYTGQFADLPEEFANSYLPRRTLQWFEKHVRGVEVDTGPAFAWFRPWVEYDVATTGGTAAPAFGTAPTFPDPSLPPTVLHVSAGGNLVTSLADVEDATLSVINPPGGVPAAYTETPNFTGPGADQQLGGPVTEIPTQNLVLATAPASEDLEFVGIPTASLQLSTANPAVDARFFAKIYEVSGGTRTLLNRQVAASRIPTSVLAEGPVTILLPPVSERIEAGNHIEVVLASTDLAYYNERTPNQLTLSSSQDAPTTVALPLRSLSAPPVAPPTPAPAPPPPLPATGGGMAIAALALLGLALRRG